MTITEWTITHLVMMFSISGIKGAAKQGSRWINVPSTMINKPISSSGYSSLDKPHPEHL